MSQPHRFIHTLLILNSKRFILNFTTKNSRVVSHKFPHCQDFSWSILHTTDPVGFIVRRAHMNILVTGGAGYIGSTVADCLIQKGHEVTVYDNLSHGHEEAVPPGALFVKGDM